MKTVNTGQIFDEALDFDAIQAIINILDDEEFLAISHHQNYIQAVYLYDSDNYMVEIRLYQSETAFTHYRYFCDDKAGVSKLFSQFYHDKIDEHYDFPSWEDVSNEFD